MAGLSHRANRGPGHVEVDDPKWHGYLANITPQEFSASYAQSLPRQISGAEFLKRYAGITDSVTSVNPAKDYPVYQATRHPINENERVNRFVEILNNDSESQRGRLLGELMYQAHKGYSDCGLGSEGTDEIVRIVRERDSDKDCLVQRSPVAAAGDSRRARFARCRPGSFTRWPPSIGVAAATRRWSSQDHLLARSALAIYG
jgi:hypothetical protein